VKSQGCLISVMLDVYRVRYIPLGQDGSSRNHELVNLRKLNQLINWGENIRPEKLTALLCPDRKPNRVKKCLMVQ
jgi:hypothetical protein